MAIACGAALAGGRGAVLIQNAGLFNCGGVLAGLVELYRIPCFFVVSYRGDGRDPVYYHEPKGRVTEPTLSAWRLPFAIADRAADLADQVVRGVERAVESRGPVRAPDHRRGSRVTPRKPLLEALVAMLAPDDVLVSCLGANARYLPHLAVPAPVFALCDSMGAAIPLALGMALQRPDRHVIALEGDGSC